MVFNILHNLRSLFVQQSPGGRKSQSGSQQANYKRQDIVGERPWRSVHCDNLVFRLHYRWTSSLLVVAAVLASSHQLMDSTGGAIQCMTTGSRALAGRTVSNYCWVMGTYTHPGEEGAYPGVGPGTGQERVVHGYYMWVPHFLLFLAALFHLPHLLWKWSEGGRMRLLIQGMEEDSEDQIDEDDAAKRSWTRVEAFTEYLKQRQLLSLTTRLQNWTLFLCEAANLLVVILSILLTNAFLGGKFWQYGAEVIGLMAESQQRHLGSDPQSWVFPTMTKCDFRMFGPSGTVNLVDALCVLGMNALNEKIFLCLWVWMALLLPLASGQVLLRLLLHLHPALRAPLLRGTLWLYDPQLNTGTEEVLEELGLGLEYLVWRVVEEVAVVVPGEQWRALVHSLAQGLDPAWSQESSKLLQLMQKLANTLHV